jgi:hypothetical protein
MRLGAAIDNTVLMAVHDLLILLRHKFLDEVLPPRQLWVLPVEPHSMRYEADI